MFRNIALASALLAAASFPAYAQSAGGGTPVTSTTTTVSNTPTASTGTLSAVTATTTSASLVAANTNRVLLYVSNEAASGGGNVAVCPTSVSTPALNAAGCKTLYPGQFWAPCSTAVCPGDAFNIIASASTPILFEQK